MKEFKGVSAAWNYTIGPAHLFEGPASIDSINLQAMPVVVVGQYLPLPDLAKIDMHHVYGFVLEGGGLGDQTRVFYSNQHRATVMQCEGILAEVQGGETIIVDGVEGKVIVDPDEATLARYEELRGKGPPPEPEGFAEQLLRDAMEMAQLDPDALKALLDFQKIGRAVDLFLKMYQVEKLSGSEVAELKEMVKGTKVEGSVAENLDKYQDAVKNMSPEELAERKARAPME